MNIQKMYDRIWAEEYKIRRANYIANERWADRKSASERSSGMALKIKKIQHPYTSISEFSDEFHKYMTV